MNFLINISDVGLYLVDNGDCEIYRSPRFVTNGRHKVNWKIEPGTIVAAFVAYNKEYVMVDDVLADTRFPDGIGYKGTYTMLSFLFEKLVV